MYDFTYPYPDPHTCILSRPPPLTTPPKFENLPLPSLFCLQVQLRARFLTLWLTTPEKTFFNLNLPIVVSLHLIYLNGITCLVSYYAIFLPPSYQAPILSLPNGILAPSEHTWASCVHPPTDPRLGSADHTHTQVQVLATKLCPILCDPLACSPSGSSRHGILQARILGWVALPFSRGSS